MIASRMTTKQIIARLDTIGGKIEALLWDETTNRAHLKAVMGESLLLDLQVIRGRIADVVDQHCEPTASTGDKD